MIKIIGRLWRKIGSSFGCSQEINEVNEQALLLGNEALSISVCRELLDAFKAQFCQNSSAYYDFFTVFKTLTAILQKFPQLAGDILEMAKLIFEKHEKLSAELVINIVHKSPELADEAKGLLIRWLEREKYDEGTLVNLYQFLGLFLQAHPDFAGFSADVAAAALQSSKNKKYALKEADLFLMNLKEICPHIWHKICNNFYK